MDKKKFFYLLISVVVAIIVYLLPIPINPQAHVILAIMMFAMIAWFAEALPLHVTAIAIAFLLIVFAGMTPEKTFAPFFDPVIVLMMGGFVLARAMQKHKLDEYMALHLLDRIGHSPRHFILGIMGITAFLSMWMSNTAAAAIVIPIGLVILAENKIKPLKSNFAKALVLGIAFASTIGGIGTLIGSTPNVIAAKFLNQAGYTFDFIDWLYYGFPFMILFVPVCWFILIRVYKPEISQLRTVKFKKHLDPKQKKILVIFAATIILWLTTRIHGHDSSTVALVPVLLLYIFGLLDTKDFTKINWPTLILLGGGLALGLSIQASGLDQVIASLIGVAVVNQPLFAAFIIITSFGILLTLVASNTAAAAVMIPMMIPLALALGMDPTTVVMLAAIGVSLDFIVPVGTPPSAIAYSTGFVKVKDMAKAGIIIACAGVILISLLAIIYW